MAGWAAEPGFVDVHSHVVPSGDDGAASIAEGLELCRAAVAAGTRTLFATPHVHAPFDQYPWSPDREARFEGALETMRPLAAALGLDLRRGREVYPTEIGTWPLESLVLEGTLAVLLEFPGSWLDVEDAVGVTWDACLRVAAAGLVPVLAHPERCPEALARADAFAERGWLLCLNGGSLLGAHGPNAERAAWELLERGLVSLVASDAHRAVERPPDLDGVHAAIVERLGTPTADTLLSGELLPWLPGRAPSVSAARRSAPSRA